MTSQNITLSASQARSDFYNLLDDVAQNFKHFIITKKGKPQTIMIPLEEFESWQETINIMTNKKLVKDIEEGLKDIEEGNILTEQELLEK